MSSQRSAPTGSITAEEIDTASVDAALTTTRAVRKRLDLERPVDLDLVLTRQGRPVLFLVVLVVAFDDERAAAYLAFRLQRAGWHEALPFSEDELSDINGRAGGGPSNIHQGRFGHSVGA